MRKKSYFLTFQIWDKMAPVSRAVKSEKKSDEILDELFSNIKVPTYFIVYPHSNKLINNVFCKVISWLHLFINYWSI